MIKSFITLTIAISIFLVILGQSKSDCKKLIVNTWHIENVNIKDEAKFKESYIKKLKEQLKQTGKNLDEKSTTLFDDAHLNKVIEDIKKNKMNVTFTKAGKFIWNDGKTAGEYILSANCEKLSMKIGNQTEPVLIKSISSSKLIIESSDGTLVTTFVSLK